MVGCRQMSNILGLTIRRIWLFGYICYWWDGFRILFVIVKKESLMIDDFIKQLFERNHIISSPRGSNKFLVGQT